VSDFAVHKAIIRKLDLRVKELEEDLKYHEESSRTIIKILREIPDDDSLMSQELDALHDYLVSRLRKITGKSIGEVLDE